MIIIIFIVFSHYFLADVRFIAIVLYIYCNKECIIIVTLIMIIIICFFV